MTISLKQADTFNIGLTHLKNQVTTNEKHTIDLQTPKRGEHKNNTKKTIKSQKENKRKKKGKMKKYKIK